jgi:multidrug efflux pump subunit AcrB
VARSAAGIVRTFLIFQLPLYLLDSTRLTRLFSGGVLPVVLLAVLTFSLLEAFLILPHHLRHSLAHSHEKKKPQWRTIFDANFLKLRDRFTSFARTAITYRYITVGIAFALFILSIGMLATGTIKFKAFPDLEGNRLEARILYPQGTPLANREPT